MAKLNILLALVAITLLVVSVNARLHGPDDDPKNRNFSLGEGPSANDDNSFAISASSRLRGPDDDPKNINFSLGAGPSANNDNSFAIPDSARLRGPDDDPKNTNFSLGAGPSQKDNNKDNVSGSARLRGSDDDPRNEHFSLGTGPSPNDDEKIEAEAPSPYTDDESWLAPEPYPGFFGFVDTCMKKLTERCGKQIFSAIFEGGGVSNRCCGELVDMGKKCHGEILKATIILPFISKETKKDFKENDAQVWSQCVSRINQYL